MDIDKIIGLSACFLITVVYAIVFYGLSSSQVQDDMRRSKECFVEKVVTVQFTATELEDIRQCREYGGIPIFSSWDGKLVNCVYPPANMNK